MFWHFLLSMFTQLSTSAYFYKHVFIYHQFCSSYLILKFNTKFVRSFGVLERTTLSVYTFPSSFYLINNHHRKNHYLYQHFTCHVPPSANTITCHQTEPEIIANHHKNRHHQFRFEGRPRQSPESIEIVSVGSLLDQCVNSNIWHWPASLQQTVGEKGRGKRKRVGVLEGDG